MKIDIDLNKMSEEEFINFLMNDINDHLFTLSQKFELEQNVKKLSAALDIIRANMNFYCLYHEYDISKAPPPQPYVVYPSGCSFDVK